jgi:hypothetical protein
VVLHHGREGGGAGHNGVRPSVFNGLLAGAALSHSRDMASGHNLSPLHNFDRDSRSQ